MTPTLTAGPLVFEVTLAGPELGALLLLAAQHDTPATEIDRLAALLKLAIGLGVENLAGPLSEEERARAQAFEPQSEVSVEYAPPWAIEDGDELLVEDEDEDEDHWLDEDEDEDE